MTNKESEFEQTTVKALTTLMHALDKLEIGAFTQGSLMGCQTAVRKIEAAHRAEIVRVFERLRTHEAQLRRKEGNYEYYVRTRHIDALIAKYKEME